MSFQPVVLYFCFDVFDFCWFDHIQFSILWWTLPFAVPIIIITKYINIYSHTPFWSLRRHWVESGPEYIPLKHIGKPKQLFFHPLYCNEVITSFYRLLMEILCQNQDILCLVGFNHHSTFQPQDSYCSIEGNLGDRTYFNWTILWPLNSYI